MGFMDKLTLLAGLFGMFLTLYVAARVYATGFVLSKYDNPEQLPLNLFLFTIFILTAGREVQLVNSMQFAVYEPYPLMLRILNIFGLALFCFIFIATAIKKRSLQT